MKVEDQASKLRQLMQEVRQVRTIAVVSGKGGVGKSNVAMNLSILLSAAGNRVTLVDADLALANLDLLIDVEVKANLSHVIEGVKRLEDILVALPGGVQLIPGASGLARLASLSQLQQAQLLQALDGLEADNDIIVIDCGAGIGPEVLNFAASADDVLVVTTSDPAAITDAYATIKVVNQRDHRGQMSLLVNFASNRQEARMIYQRIAKVTRHFLGMTVFDAGYVLDDAKVREAVRRREPFVLAYPRCPASRCLAALATKLSAGGGLTGKKEGLFRRVANWFA